MGTEPEPRNDSNQNQEAFPLTDWSQLIALRAAVSTERRAVLGFFIGRYWKPVYCYLRRSGQGEEEAKDLVQAFFERCLCKNFFDQADPERGRFRNFLLKSLKYFVSKDHERKQAKIRCPAGGFVSIDELAECEGFDLKAVTGGTPDQAYDRAYWTDLIHRVLCLLEQECQITGKEKHYALFRQRIILPALEGSEPPSLRALARELGLSEQEAKHRLQTARRAYQRLLREEIRVYASDDEEVAEEIQDLFRFLSGS